MTTIPNFDITSDLKVEFFLPDTSENAFIIGISTLGRQQFYLVETYLS
jgi:hypothetical protein